MSGNHFTGSEVAGPAWDHVRRPVDRPAGEVAALGEQSRSVWQRYIGDRWHVLWHPPVENFDDYTSRQFTEWSVLTLAFGATFLCCTLAVFGALEHEALGVTADEIALTCGAGIALGAIGWLYAPRAGIVGAEVLMAVGIVIVACIVGMVDDLYAGYLAVGFIGGGLSVAIGRGLNTIQGASVFGLVIASGAVVTALVRSDAIGWLGWIGTMTATFAVALTTERLVRPLRRLAQQERATKAESDRMSVELADVSRHKSEFLAGMSHELRTPLNAIIGFSEVLERRMPGELNERQGMYVADIVDSGHQLLTLINDVLDIAKVDAGRMELDIVDLELSSTLETAVAAVRDRAAEGHVDLDVDVAEDVQLRADARKVHQIAVALLANAVRCTPEDGTVTVTGSVTDARVRVTVSDSGPGIARADQERMFEEFAQSNDGTGLGLALARRLAELHGGTLEVASDIGAGATFTLVLPLDSADDANPETTSPAPPAEPSLDEQLVREPDPLVPLPFIARLGAIAGYGFAVATGLSALLVDHPDFDRAVAGWSTAFAVVMSTLVLVAASHITRAQINVLGIGFIVATSIGVYYAGPLRSYAALIYVAFISLQFAFRSLRVALVHVGAIAIGHAVVLAIQPGNEAPFAQWLATMVIIAVVGRVARTMLVQTRAVATTERLAREESERISAELAEVSRHKSEFLAGMSHELRTPLNAIIGFAEVLDRGLPGELNERQRRYITDIVESGKHLLALINDVLDLARVEAGRMELEPSEADLGSVLDNAMRLVRERAERGGVALLLIAEPDLLVRADERKLRQVVVNLLSNAVKFTPPNGRVTVRGRKIRGGFEVSVADTGQGVAPEDQERIFEEFAQAGAGPTRARSHEGTGLGLALARQFVELHGGRLWVDSTPGEGATFTFTIPTHPNDAAPGDPTQQLVATN